MSVVLNEYEGRHLTIQEIDLLKLFERQHSDARRKNEEELLSRELLLTSSSATTRKYLEDAASNVIRAAQTSKSELIESAPAQKTIENSGAGKTVLKRTAVDSELLDLKFAYSLPSIQQNDLEEEEAEQVESSAIHTSESVYKIKKKRLQEEMPLGDDLLEPADNRLHSLFDTLELQETVEWDSSVVAEPFDIKLPKFSEGNDTLLMQLKVPKQSASWSINITPRQNSYGFDILLHFNVRYRKNKLVLNDRQGTWGIQIDHPLQESSKREPLRAPSLILVFVILPEGFAVFCNDIYRSFFPHRRDPSIYR